jgi:REP element-mobilizing transposase RayT
MLSINSMPDHLHMFFGMRPSQSISDLMQFVKGESSEWINTEGLTNNTFRWQGGYAAFSYSRSHISRVCNYIERQQEHHKKKTFLEEYHEMLRSEDIEFDERFIFKPLE